MRRLGALAAETGTAVYAWALMDNHAHILLSSGSLRLAKFMPRLSMAPRIADDTPENAIVVMQLEKDLRFNHWSRKLAKAHVTHGQPVVYVHIQKLTFAISN